jgi:hypothetical protein
MADSGAANCKKTRPTVIGSVLVYIGNHHFMQAYGETLTPYLKQRLLAMNVVRRLISG